MDIPKISDTSPKTYERVDKASAEIVDKGIVFQQLYGTQAAAEYLKNKMIGIEVVLRVLARRLKRRGINIEQHGTISNASQDSQVAPDISTS